MIQIKELRNDSAGRLTVELNHELSYTFFPGDTLRLGEFSQLEVSTDKNAPLAIKKDFGSLQTEIFLYCNELDQVNEFHVEMQEDRSTTGVYRLEREVEQVSLAFRDYGIVIVGTVDVGMDSGR